MVGLFVGIGTAIGCGISGLKKCIRDDEFKKRQMDNDLPVWSDSCGYYRWKDTDRKVDYARYDSRRHFIISDKGKDIDWTLHQILKEAKKDNKFHECGEGSFHDIHINNEPEGMRYVRYKDGKYTFYTKRCYKDLCFYMNVKTCEAEIVTKESVKQEEESKKFGKDYYSKKDRNKIIKEFNQLPLEERKNRRYKELFEKWSYTTMERWKEGV